MLTLPWQIMKSLSDTLKIGKKRKRPNKKTKHSIWFKLKSASSDQKPKCLRASFCGKPVLMRNRL